MCYSRHETFEEQSRRRFREINNENKYHTAYQYARNIVSNKLTIILLIFCLILLYNTYRLTQYDHRLSEFDNKLSKIQSVYDQHMSTINNMGTPLYEIKMNSDTSRKNFDYTYVKLYCIFFCISVFMCVNLFRKIDNR